MVVVVVVGCWLLAVGRWSLAVGRGSFGSFGSAVVWSAVVWSAVVWSVVWSVGCLVREGVPAGTSFFES